MNSILHLKPLADLFFAEVEGFKNLVQKLQEENNNLKQENRELISTLIKYENELEKCSNWMSAGDTSLPCCKDLRGANNSNAPCDVKSDESKEKGEEHQEQGVQEEHETTEKPKRNRKDYMREYQRQYRKTKREQQTPPVEMIA